MTSDETKAKRAAYMRAYRRTDAGKVQLAAVEARRDKAARREKARRANMTPEQLEAARAKDHARRPFRHRKSWGCVDGPVRERKVGQCESPGCGFSGVLLFDHDHSNGRFRGWLCRLCNTGSGMFGDSPERLRAHAAWIENRTKHDIPE